MVTRPATLDPSSAFHGLDPRSRTAHLLQLLLLDAQWTDPNPERARVTALEHALQTATRAWRWALEDVNRRGDVMDTAVVCALLHDAARPLSDAYHGEVIAAVLRDRVPVEWWFALRHHGCAQHALLHPDDVRCLLVGSPWQCLVGDRTWLDLLAQWDAASFDPTYPVLPLHTFVPSLGVVLGEAVVLA